MTYRRMKAIIQRIKETNYPDMIQVLIIIRYGQEQLKEDYREYTNY